MVEEYFKPNIDLEGVQKIETRDFIKISLAHIGLRFNDVELKYRRYSKGFEEWYASPNVVRDFILATNGDECEN